ncbi:MAG: DnaD domain protein [Clostridia bacterium]|nr:DnaD domain protein [Clostridia bacterium]
MNKTAGDEAVGIRLPYSTAEHLSAASKIDLALLIRIAAEGRPVEAKTDFERFAADIGASREELERSLYFLRGASLIVTDAEGRIKISGSEETASVHVRERKLLSADVPQRFTSGEIRRITEENQSLSSLFDACQQAMGKIFTTDEFNIVISLYEYYGFETDYILLLCAHCAGRQKNLRYVEKMAHTLYDKDIVTYTALEEYFTRLDALESAEGQLRTLFGFGSRTLTAKEREFFMRWLMDFSCSLELIEYAYEITVDRTGKVKLPYINKILENWYSADYNTPDEVKNAERDNHPESVLSSFNTDDFFDLALKRSYADMSETDKKPTKV